jgi:hypothetical protein
MIKEIFILKNLMVPVVVKQIRNFPRTDDFTATFGFATSNC